MTQIAEDAVIPSSIFFSSWQTIDTFKEWTVNDVVDLLDYCGFNSSSKAALRSSINGKALLRLISDGGSDLVLPVDNGGLGLTPIQVFRVKAEIKEMVRTGSVEMEQHVWMVSEVAKRQTLHDLLATLFCSQQRPEIIIFVQTELTAYELTNQLLERSYPVLEIHQRKMGDSTLLGKFVWWFKTGCYPILVATDEQVRELGIWDIQYVINYDLPSCIEVYRDRIRPARRAQAGAAFTFFSNAAAHNADTSLVQMLEDKMQADPKDFERMVNFLQHSDVPATFQAVLEECSKQSDVQGICALCEQHWSEFNAANIATSIHRLGKFRSSKTFDRARVQANLRNLERVAISRGQNFNPQEVANLMWGLGRLQDQNVGAGLELKEVMLCQAMVVSESFKPQEISNLFWAFVHLEFKPGEDLLNALLKRVMQCCQDFNAQCLSTLMHCLAKLEFRPGDDLVQAIIAQVIVVSDDFKTQDISNFMSACAKMSLDPNSEVLTAIFTCSEKAAFDFKPQEIADLVWACATLRIHLPFELQEAMLQQSGIVSKQFKPREISNLFWGIAKLKLDSDWQICDMLLDRALVAYRDFKAQEIANLFWALASLPLRPKPALVWALSYQSVSVQDDFVPQGLTTLLTAFADLDLRLEQVLEEAILTRALHSAQSFKAHEISNFLTALSQFEMQSRQQIFDVVDAMCLCSISIMSDFTPDILCALMAAFAKLSAVPSRELVSAVSCRALSTIDEITDQNVSSLLKSFVDLGLPLETRFQDAMLVRVLLTAENLSSPEISNLIPVFSMLGIVLGRECSDEAGCKRTISLISEFTPRTLCGLMSAFAKILAVPSLELVSAVSCRTLSTIEEFTDQNISSLLQSFADLGLQLERSMENAILKQVLRIVESLSSFEISNMFSTLPKLGILPDSQFIEAICRRSISIISDFTPQILCTLMSALAKLSAEPSLELVSAVSCRAVSTIEEFTGQNISSMLEVFADMGLKIEKSFEDAMLKQALRIASNLSSFEISVLIAALSKFAIIPDAALVEAIRLRSIAILTEFNKCDPQDTVNIAWAFSQMRLKPAEMWTETISSCVLANVEKFDAEHLCKLLKAYARMGSVPTQDVSAALLNRAMSCVSTFRATNVSDLMWALAMMELKPGPELAGEMLKRAVTCAEHFEPKEIANFVWSLTEMGLSPDPMLEEALSVRIQHVVDFFNSQQVVSLTGSLAKLKCSADFKTFCKEAVCKRVLDLLDAISSLEGANLICSFVKLGLPSDTDPLLSLFRKVGAELDALDSTSVSKVMRALVELDHGKDSRSGLFKALLNRFQNQIEGSSAAAISEVLRALAKLNLKGETTLIYATLVRALVLKDEFDCESVANMLWALAKLKPNCGRHTSLVIEAISKRALEIRAGFNRHCVVRVMWALAKLNLKSGRELFEALQSNELLVRGPSMNGQEASNLMWAHATLGIEPRPEFIRALLSQSEDIVQYCNSQAVATLTWAIAKLKGKYVESVAEGFNEFALVQESEQSEPVPLAINPYEAELQPDSSKQNLQMAGFSSISGIDLENFVLLLSNRAEKIAKAFNAQDVTNMMWALATLRISPKPELEKIISARALETVPDFLPQAISNLMSSYANMNLQPDSALLEAITTRAVKIASDFNPQAVSNLMWALAKLKFQPTEELVRSMLHVSLLKRDVFQPQGIANLMWALAKLGLDPGSDLMEAMTKRAEQISTHFVGQSISVLMWSLVKLRNKVDVTALCRVLSNSAIETIPTLGAQGIANLTWSLAKLEVNPEVSMLHAISQRAVYVAREFTSQGILNLLWAFEQLKYDPGQSFEAAFGEWFLEMCLNNSETDSCGVGSQTNPHVENSSANSDISSLQSSEKPADLLSFSYHPLVQEILEIVNSGDLDMAEWWVENQVNEEPLGDEMPSLEPDDIQLLTWIGEAISRMRFRSDRVLDWSEDDVVDYFRFTTGRLLLDVKSPSESPMNGQQLLLFLKKDSRILALLNIITGVNDRLLLCRIRNELLCESRPKLDRYSWLFDTLAVPCLRRLWHECWQTLYGHEWDQSLAAHADFGGQSCIAFCLSELKGKSDHSIDKVAKSQGDLDLWDCTALIKMLRIFHQKDRAQKPHKLDHSQILRDDSGNPRLVKQRPDGSLVDDPVHGKEHYVFESVGIERNFIKHMGMRDISEVEFNQHWDILKSLLISLGEEEEYIETQYQFA